jgi:hypothetical protein
MGYIVPIAAFVLLLVSSWDWMWKTKKPWRPSTRGWIVFGAGIIVLSLGWRQYRSDVDENRRILKSIEREGTRLVPSDFQVRLDTWAHASAISHGESGWGPPERVDLFMSIDSLLVTGELVLRPASAREYAESRSPNEYWYYSASDLFVRGLDRLSYLDQLEGKVLEVYIPRRAFGRPFRSRLAGIRANVSIKGRQFKIMQEDTTSGIVELKITHSMLFQD